MAMDAAPRILLKRLRGIMAEKLDSQERLNRIVRQIAGLMVAEVCSIYVRRQDGSLELFATEGLNPEAVHKTHMKRGEGLVGLVAEAAEAVNLPDAQSHPAFSYRPETGEEVYHAFLGVPILRGGRVLGIVTVQNKTQRHYSPDEEEALQTTAMVLAEHLASGEVVGADSSNGPISRPQGVVIKGQSLSDGIALGRVVLHEPRVVVTQLDSDDVIGEARRLSGAIDELRGQIDKMLVAGDLSATGEHREILETYRMFAHDRGWIRRIEEAIATGLTAEAAVERVRNDMRAKMLRQTDPFWRERFKDLDDLSDRLLRVLAGKGETAASEVLPKDAILIARTMGPAELLDYDRTRLRGLIIEEGGPTSHVAIVARALGIAALGQAGGVVEAVELGDRAIVDADTGEFHLRPGPDIIQAYTDKARFRARRLKRFEALRDKRAISKDGEEITLLINSGLLVDLPHLAESGSDGIGLFRTELEFMISSTFPRRERQTAIYRDVLQAAGDLPVVFRSLDLGGDKLLPYFRHATEENPALGWRAIRMALDRQGLFRAQMRALLSAGEGRDLRVMLPMVTDICEYEEAERLLQREIKLLAKFGRERPKSIRLGAMVEVPAILWQLDELCERAHFLSIGSNDLFQFLFAADRANTNVAERYDPLGLAGLRVLRHIIETAKRHDTPLNLCGELASRPLEAMALIGLGLRSISMAPAAIGAIKAMVMSLDIAQLAGLIDELIAQGATDTRAALQEFAVANKVDV